LPHRQGGSVFAFREPPKQPATEKGILQVGVDLRLLQPGAQLIGVIGRASVLGGETVQIELTLQGELPHCHRSATGAQVFTLQTIPAWEEDDRLISAIS
jgi:hypothetical protein